MATTKRIDTQAVLELLNWLYYTTDLLKSDVVEAMGEDDFTALPDDVKALVEEWVNAE